MKFRRNAIKITAVTAALAMLLTCPAFAVGSVTATPAPFEEGSQEAVKIGSSFYDYLQKNADAQNATAKITLLPATGKLTGSAKLSTLDGRASAAVLGEGDTLTWEFEVAQDGLYAITVAYYNLAAKPRNMEISLRLDGAAPYLSLEEITLKRSWANDGKITRDKKGNDVLPKAVEVCRWKSELLRDAAGFSYAPLQLRLTKGKHTLTLKSEREPLAIGEVALGNVVEPISYQEWLSKTSAKPVAGYFQLLEAEAPAERTDQSIRAVYDRSSPKTQPYDVSRIRRNTIGADTWGQPGMSVSYDVTVDQAGLYLLSLKYRQDLCRDRSTYRTIYVNGELQNSAFQEIPFEYDIKWNIKTVSDGDAPAYLFLKQGTNRITLEVTAGQIGSLLQKVESINMELSRVYRKIIMITGTSPDKFRDFNLEREIPGLVESIESIAARLDAVIAEYTAFGKSNSSYLFQLRKISSQLRELAKEPQTIPERLKVFRDDINALSNWLLDSTLQSLELDYLVVHSAGQPLPSPRATVWESAAHNVRAFLASFVSDYNSFSTEEEKTPQSITIWSGEGRDQAQMLKTLVEDSFIPQTGIQVNLSLVTQGFIEASLAGRNPDISIGVARGQPVNLACRNALEDLSHFDTFDEVVARFIPGATVPYQYNGQTYALPNKQSYFMMYYRMDIFEELGLSIPNTWEDVYQLIPVLQRKNMEIGFPYTVLTSAGSIDLGMGSKDMFPCFLMQSGGQFYNDQQTGVALDTPQAMAAFKKWTDFYTKYSFSTAYSYYERFRSGQMPLMIQNLGAYGMFAAAAPEIRNLWAIAPIPGTVQPDGSIDRTVASEGTATVMFKNAQNKEACWDFLDWWMRAETQSSYALSMENLMGPAARYTTANLEAFDSLPWTKKELACLQQQRAFVREVPEIPGGYFVSRCLDNAFRSVTTDFENPREIFEDQVKKMNREIARKQREIRGELPNSSEQAEGSRK